MARGRRGAPRGPPERLHAAAGVPGDGQVGRRARGAVHAPGLRGGRPRVFVRHARPQLRALRARRDAAARGLGAARPELLRAHGQGLWAQGRLPLPRHDRAAAVRHLPHVRHLHRDELPRALGLLDRGDADAGDVLRAAAPRARAALVDPRHADVRDDEPHRERADLVRVDRAGAPRDDDDRARPAGLAATLPLFNASRAARPSASSTSSPSSSCRKITMRRVCPGPAERRGTGIATPSSGVASMAWRSTRRFSTNPP